MKFLSPLSLLSKFSKLCRWVSNNAQKKAGKSRDVNFMFNAATTSYIFKNACTHVYYVLSVQFLYRSNL